MAEDRVQCPVCREVVVLRTHVPASPLRRVIVRLRGRASAAAAHLLGWLVGDER